MASTTSTHQKTSWADDVDELDRSGAVGGIGIIEDSVDENGVRTVVEITVNEDGKKVKVTRKIKRTLQKSVVEHAVAARQKWSKFGQERGKARGLDRAMTIIGESISLKLSAGNKAAEAEPTPEQSVKNQLARAGAGKVVCKLCKGDHFTVRCPYKDSLAGLDTTEVVEEEVPQPMGAAANPTKYIPPSMRGARGPGESMSRPGGGSRDDLPTLRVTNLSEDTQEGDLRDLFGRFGRVARVYVGRDRETGAGKGFAFVSFEDRANAQKAMEKVNGLGYDSLILSVQWSQPRPEQK